MTEQMQREADAASRSDETLAEAFRADVTALARRLREGYEAARPRLDAHGLALRELWTRRRSLSTNVVRWAGSAARARRGARASASSSADQG